MGSQFIKRHWDGSLDRFTVSILNLYPRIQRSIHGGCIEAELLKELALALYAQDLLSFGKARELANLDHWQFSQLLGERNIPRHYSETELAEDLDYARRQ